MRATFATVIVAFSKVPFWRLFDHSYAETSFAIIMRHQYFERHPTVEDFRGMDEDVF